MLDALAKDFQAHHFDLRYLMALITNSATVPAFIEFSGRMEGAIRSVLRPTFCGRLPAAQIWDAICVSTGLPLEIPILRSNHKVKYVLQTMDPDDLGGEVKPLGDLLDSLGHYNRYAVGDDSSGGKVSVLQASILMNNPLIRERVKAQKGSRLLALLEAEPPKATTRSSRKCSSRLFLVFRRKRKKRCR